VEKGRVALNSYYLSVMRVELPGQSLYGKWLKHDLICERWYGGKCRYVSSAQCFPDHAVSQDVHVKLSLLPAPALLHRVIEMLLRKLPLMGLVSSMGMQRVA
jgi:hypothetical protein